MISVILNVYNDEKHIKKCLDSVINQTYKDIEIIIVNDGSSDNTLKVLKEYKDKRIKIINNKKNMGLSLSRNVGIDNSKGEYLFFVDSDDYIEEDTIDYLYNLCKKNKVEMSTCNCLDVYDYDTKAKDVEERITIEPGISLLKKVLLSENRKGTIWNKLIKRELFDDIRFEDRIINDVVVVYKLALKVKKIAFSNKTKYYYLRHKESIVAKHKTEWTIDLYDAAIERYNYIKNIYPDLIENDICILKLLIDINNFNDKKVDKYLKEKKAKKLYNKLFSFKVLRSKISFEDKFKIVIYRVSPRFLRFITKVYLKIKGKR